jgi:hypothetical protein
MTPTDRVSSEMPDPELIARVLDGRATAAERAQLLRQADESPEALAVLADAAAVMVESTTGAGVVDIRAHRRTRVPTWVWMSAAAAVIVAIAVPSIRAGRPDLPGLPVLSIGGSRAIAAARVGAPIATTRGASDDITARSTAIGMLLVDYVTLGADTAKATVGLELATALRAIDGGSTVASRIGPTMPVDKGLLEAIEQFVDVRVFRAAGWTELVRLASAQADSSIRLRLDVRDAVEAMATDRHFPPAVRASAGALRSSFRAVPPDWKRIGDDAAALLAALSSAGASETAR